MNVQIEIYLKHGWKFKLLFDMTAYHCLKNFLDFIQKNITFNEASGISDYFRYIDNEKDLIIVRDDAGFEDFLRHIAELSSKNEETTQVSIFFDGSSVDSKTDVLTVDTSNVLPYFDEFTACHSSHNVNNVDFLDDLTLNPDEFKQLSVLGYGHCGTVYKTLNIKTDQIVAVKCQPVDVSDDIQRKILAELSVLRRCHSPYIIDFHGVCFMDFQIAMSTEYMDGGSLREYGKIEEKLLCSVAVSVVKGLEYLWSIKIMHRDVKPSNILINTSGFIKLCDFGMSIQLETSIAKSYVGTNAYMAPERLQGGEYRVCSDVWSLGVSLMEMALGKFPFKNLFEASNAIDNPVDFMSRILSQDVPNLEPPEFSEHFCTFVNSCVNTRADERPNPDKLSTYPLIIDNESLDRNYIAQWLKIRLESKDKI